VFDNISFDLIIKKYLSKEAYRKSFAQGQKKAPPINQRSSNILEEIK
jgi:hypothetical protein